MSTCRASSTTGSSSTKLLANGDDSCDDPSSFRRAVGKLQWAVGFRPDLAYASKELARGLSSPTLEDFAKLKHVLRYLRGTLNYVFVIRPSVNISLPAAFDIQVFSDSDWAGCSKTRRSTSGGVVTILSSPIAFFSRTQTTIALSSAEAEMYAMGSSCSEALFVRNLLLESGFASRTTTTIFTDSSAAKSIVSRFRGFQEDTTYRDEASLSSEARFVRASHRQEGSRNAKSRGHLHQACFCRSPKASFA